MLVATGLTKEYQSGDHRLTVLRDVSFTIEQGSFVAIVGPSGSGKTTLLGLMAGLDTASRGTVQLDNADLVHGFHELYSAIDRYVETGLNEVGVGSSVSLEKLTPHESVVAFSLKSRSRPTPGSGSLPPSRSGSSRRSRPRRC